MKIKAREESTKIFIARILILLNEIAHYNKDDGITVNSIVLDATQSKDWGQPWGDCCYTTLYVKALRKSCLIKFEMPIPLNRLPNLPSY